MDDWVSTYISQVEVRPGAQTLVTQLTSDGRAVLQVNPRFDALPGLSFSVQHNLLLPELRGLVGNIQPLAALVGLYARLLATGKGSVVFIPAAQGFGSKALGRVLMDAIAGQPGSKALTRFWPAGESEKVLKDPRWFLEMERMAPRLAQSPPYLVETAGRPLQAILAQLYRQKLIPSAGLPEILEHLPGFLAHLATKGRPLILFLEDFHHAPPQWHTWLQGLADRIYQGCPVLFVVALHTDHPNSSAALKLAETMHLHRRARLVSLEKLTRQEISAYTGDLTPRLLERLDSLAAGNPLLLQALWEYFIEQGEVERTFEGEWDFNPRSGWQEWESGLAYVQAILAELYELDARPPWPQEQMLAMLAYAARSGPTFAPSALARVFNLSQGLLLDALSYLVDGVDDEMYAEPGLVAPIDPEDLPADERFGPLRYRFQPLIVWTALRDLSSLV